MNNQVDEQQAIICTNCGAPRDQSHRFCANCGAPAELPAAPYPPAPPIMPYPPIIPMQPVRPMRPRVCKKCDTPIGHVVECPNCRTPNYYKPSTLSCPACGGVAEGGRSGCLILAMVLTFPIGLLFLLVKPRYTCMDCGYMFQV